jgi:hypothetical protein
MKTPVGMFSVTDTGHNTYTTVQRIMGMVPIEWLGLVESFLWNVIEPSIPMAFAPIPDSNMSRVENLRRYSCAPFSMRRVFGL